MTTALRLSLLLVLSSLTLALSGCAFPKRDPKGLPDASVIKVELQDGRWVAVPPECLSLFTEARRPSHDHRPQYPFGCATYQNLAKAVANPRDLILPASYTGQNIDTAIGAVERYRQDQVTPLKETTTTQEQ